MYLDGVYIPVFQTRCSQQIVFLQHIRNCSIFSQISLIPIMQQLSQLVRIKLIFDKI